MNEYTEMMRKATLSQIVDFIKNGDPSEIDAMLDHEQDSFKALNELENAISSKLSIEDAESLIDEVNNCLFRIENISFQNGIKIGLKMFKEIMKI